MGEHAGAHCWRWIAPSPNVRGVDPNDEPKGEQAPPVRSRPAPGPRAREQVVSADPSPEAAPPAPAAPTTPVTPNAPVTPVTPITPIAPVTPAVPSAREQHGGATREAVLGATQDLMGRPNYAAMGRRAAEERTAPTNIYRARRPAVAALLIVPATGLGLLMLRALAISAFGKTFVLGGVIASSLMLAALPLLVLGLYGLITGASHGAEQWGSRVWARPPLAYLLIGLAFAATAGLAVP